MAQPMNVNNPPAWANPNASSASGGVGTMQMQATTTSSNAAHHESELFKPYSTLDEPVKETIMRDVHAVWSKLKVVLLPIDRSALQIGYSAISQVSGGAVAVPTGNNDNSENSENSEGGEGYPMLTNNEKEVIQRLKDWDLWGPLVVCLALAVLLSFKAPTNQASLVFATIFTSVWFGSAIITINAQLLGGSISFFQSVCVLGYCIFPMTCAAFIIDIVKITWFKRWYWIDLLLIGAGFMWAIRASSVFIGLYVTKERRALAVFPVLFFYTFLGWLILLF